MRKDLRIGLGIGGVLLAVLIVALVVNNNKHNKQEVVKPTTPEDVEPTPPGDPGTPVVPTVTPPITPPLAGDPTPVRPTPDPVFGDPAPATPTERPTATAGGHNWEEILSSGRIDQPSVTGTPTPAPPRRGTGTGGGASAGLPPLSATQGGAGTGGVNPVVIDPLATTPPPLTRPPTPTLPGHGPAAAGQRTHVVQQGETFTSIAQSVYGNSRYYLQIIKANPNVDPTRLKIGTTIELPDIAVIRDRAAARGTPSPTATVDRGREYRVESGDSLFRISQKLYGNINEVDALYELNKAAIGPDRERLKLNMVLKLPKTPVTATR